MAARMSDLHTQREHKPELGAHGEPVHRLTPARNSVLLYGTKFNGLSQANAYGDDAQMATNYPIVKLTNESTRHVIYARTHDHSTMAVGYTGTTYTHVDLPPNMERGLTLLQVIANGIASQTYTVGIH